MSAAPAAEELRDIGASGPAAEDRPPGGDGLPRAILILGLVAWTALACFLRRPHTGDYQDEGYYFVSAQALRDGLGYSLPSRPTTPPNAYYPIGVPGAAALAMSLMPGTPSFPRDLAAARGMILAAAWVFFLGSYAWLRRVGVRPWPAALVTLATAFNPITFLEPAILVMSDMPYAAVAAVVLLLWTARGGWTVPAAALAGALSGLGVLVRVNGIGLVIASAIRSLLGPRRLSTTAACLLAAGLVVVPYLAYTRTRTGALYSVGYKNHTYAYYSIDRVVGIVLENTRSAYEFLPHAILPPTMVTPPVVRALEAAPPLRWAVGLVVWAVFAAGLARALRGPREVVLPVGGLVLSSLAMFLGNSWGLYNRFLLFLLPMVFAAFAAGAEALGRRAGLDPRRANWLAPAAALLILVGGAATMARVAWKARAVGGVWGDVREGAALDAAYAYIRTELEPDAVVVTRTPETVYLYTGRQGVPLIEEPDILMRRYGRFDHIRRWMERAPGRPFYLLYPRSIPGWTSIDLPFAAPLLANPECEIRDIYRSPDGRIAVARIRPAACR